MAQRESYPKGILVTNTDQTEPLLLTLEDAAKRLSVSKRTLEREIERGRFPQPIRIGRAVRVRLADLFAYLSGLSAPAA